MYVHLSSGFESLVKDKKMASKPLPKGWKKCHTSDGKIYYEDDNTKTTHWKIPDSAYKTNPPSKTQQRNNTSEQQRCTKAGWWALICLIEGIGSIISGAMMTSDAEDDSGCTDSYNPGRYYYDCDTNDDDALSRCGDYGCDECLWFEKGYGGSYTYQCIFNDYYYNIPGYCIGGCSDYIPYNWTGVIILIVGVISCITALFVYVRCQKEPPENNGQSTKGKKKKKNADKEGDISPPTIFVNDAKYIKYHSNGDTPFVDGVYSGTYKSGKQSYDINEFEMRFSNGIVTGFGSDDVGDYNIKGIYSDKTGRMAFDQVYADSPEDNLKIRLEYDRNGEEFTGNWYAKTAKYQSDGQSIVIGKCKKVNKRKANQSVKGKQGRTNTQFRAKKTRRDSDNTSDDSTDSSTADNFKRKKADTRSKTGKPSRQSRRRDDSDSDDGESNDSYLKRREKRKNVKTKKKKSKFVSNIDDDW